MTESVRMWPLVANTIRTGGNAVIAAYGPMRGGFIENPPSAIDQGIPLPEILYVDLVNQAGTTESSTTFPVQPGSTFSLPANFSGIVSVNALSSGHRFSGVIYQPDRGSAPSEADFPPAGNTSLLSALPQYLYQQYDDDEDLLAFVDSFNTMVQEYMDWFAGVGLPVYTGLQAPLLDWILEGVYGILRPSLPSGHGQVHGPLNTLMMNDHPLNELHLHGSPNYYLTSDDVLKRIATWSLYTDDGKTFNIRWLKRRVERFLTGLNGTGGNTDQTYDISVTFGPGGIVNINLQSIRRFATGGSLLNVSPLNGFGMNELDTDYVVVPVSPLAPIFKAAVDSGALPLPFQLTPVVNIN